MVPRSALVSDPADGARTIQFHITGRSIEPERVAEAGPTSSLPMARFVLSPTRRRRL